MRRWVVRFACVLVLGSSLASFGQEPSGPRTLENLLKLDESEKSGAPAAADGTDSGPKRPEGTVSRPKDGVQHPDLDKAWADYDAAVAKTTESIKAGIAKQLDRATSKGDFDAAKKLQEAQNNFENAGELPATTDTKSTVSSANAEFKRAKDELTKAYDGLVKSLTMKKKIGEAQSVHDECSRFRESGHNAPPKAELAKALRPNAGIAPVPPRLPIGATLHITCDNSYEVWHNGRFLGAGHDFATLGQYRLQIQHGDVLAICAYDREGEKKTAGLFCCLVLDNGKAWGTGKDWLCSMAAPPEGWQQKQKQPKPLPEEANASEDNIAPNHLERPLTYGGKVTGKFIWSADPALRIWVRQVIDFKNFR
jgi:hypothetical protein